ncbi:response regulator [Ammoniphilus sp. CFH 90114]|uniref:response regulator n=1 Tax=Ammoniphilus sp. CFH 90114 TaxID=2493665 RepID=UPI00100E0B54|nr:response regulator [Ammoniphilus sp. CFH 90114]RXT07960.1 response regulator [Ammoniphilus sp. CFH 90114]
MDARILIVDDDPVCRRMLTQIIEDHDIGVVIGTVEDGSKALRMVKEENPDIVLMDLLMPELDGIETMKELRDRNYEGKVVMLSQVVNKDMVGEAYQMGVEFYIHKPINKIEVLNVMNKVKEYVHLQRSLWTIKNSLNGLDHFQPKRIVSAKTHSIREVVVSLLSDLGIVGESGSEEIISIMEYLVQTKCSNFPPLKELYESLATRSKAEPSEVIREGKAIEQRLRRVVLASLNHLASLGLTDYAHPKFEHYAVRYFDFHDVRLEMMKIEKSEERGKSKVNIKKFLHVLYLDTLDKLVEQ